jgi:hypothetical protein
MGKGGGGQSSAGGMAVGGNSAEINRLETQLKFERKAKADCEQVTLTTITLNTKPKLIRARADTGRARWSALR